MSYSGDKGGCHACPRTHGRTDGRNVKIGLEFWNRIRNCLTFVRGLQNVKYKILAATISSHNLNSLLPSSSNAKCPNGNLRCNPVWLELQCFYWRLWHFPQKILKLLWHTKEMLSCHVWQMWQPVFCCKNRSILINRLGMAMGHQTRLNHMVPVDCWDTSWSIFEVKRHSYKMPKLVHT